MNWSRRHVLAGLAVLPIGSCAHRAGPPANTVGGVTRLSPALDAVVDADTPVEVLSTGYRWAEGPVWVRKGSYLLFSDPPNNVIHRWTPGGGTQKFITPSGLQTPVPATLREAGANGLAIDAAGRLVFADSGTRALARLDLGTGRREILVDRFDGKRFNSPNDVAIARSGAVYFSDPPYGLAEGDTSPVKELGFNGLFRWSPDGGVRLLDSSHRRPNGVALSPDQRTLYLALSDETKAQVLAYRLDAQGMPQDSRLFHDMSDGIARKAPGLPDGIKTDIAGRVYATGPGGVHILAPDGEPLGLIATGKAVANCAFGEDGRTLFLTSHDMLARIRLKARGWEAG